MDTRAIQRLFDERLTVINLGLRSFADNLHQAGAPVVHLDWQPPCGGDVELARALQRLQQVAGERIAVANAEAVKRLLAARPMLVGIGTARDVLPGMAEDLFLHAGPPVTWERMSGPQRGAVIGGLMYEGRAQSPEEAARLAASGALRFEPCHHHSAVGPMAGVVTPSMPVWIFRNEAAGNSAYITLNEGLGKVLRYGAYGREVLTRLKWIEQVLAPILSAVLDQTGPLDMKALISQALQMGDEGHNRNRAGTSLLIREIAPAMHVLGPVTLPLGTDKGAAAQPGAATTGAQPHAGGARHAPAAREATPEDLRDVLRFIHGNDHFFLNLSMGAAKCTADAAAGIEASSVITTMARNGTDWGLRVSGLGECWFSAPSPLVDGLYLPGFTAADAAPDIGDSVITETVGIGGMAMAAAPAIVKFVGGKPADALATTQRMYRITLAEHDRYQIPALDFRGTPTGIDLLAVARTGVLPAVNTGIAHKEPGIGMVGAGLVTPPRACFLDAARAFAARYLTD